jgi:NAD(P)-dependent dehydrogenase (short-subunit alcohol dehydrogenase family)
VQDKVCIATGASRGIGRRLAVDLARDGVIVTLAISSWSTTGLLRGRVRNMLRSRLLSSDRMIACPLFSLRSERHLSYG